MSRAAGFHPADPRAIPRSRMAASGNSSRTADSRWGRKARSQESGEVSAFRVEAVDTVAAGDAFGGALAVALAEGAGLREAVRFGAAAGALAVTRPGAQEAMPSRREVEALVRRV